MIGDVCGLGLMVVIELFEGGDIYKLVVELVSKIVVCVCEKGLILFFCGIYYNVICFFMFVIIFDV